MVDETDKPRRRKWPYAVLAALIVLSAALVAGMWLAGRGERSVKAVVEEYAAAYAGLDTPKDVPGLLSLYASDAVLRDVAMDRTHQGTSEIEDSLNALLATADFDLTVERTLTGDDWALVLWTADGKVSNSGRVTQVSGVTVLEVFKGKISRETWYYDPEKAPF